MSLFTGRVQKRAIEDQAQKDKPATFTDGRLKKGPIHKKLNSLLRPSIAKEVVEGKTDKAKKILQDLAKDEDYNPGLTLDEHTHTNFHKDNKTGDRNKKALGWWDKVYKNILKGVGLSEDDRRRLASIHGLKPKVVRVKPLKDEAEEAKERANKEREREAKEREAKERESKEREAKERANREREREVKERQPKEREAKEKKPDMLPLPATLLGEMALAGSGSTRGGRRPRAEIEVLPSGSSVSSRPAPQMELQPATGIVAPAPVPITSQPQEVVPALRSRKVNIYGDPSRTTSTSQPPTPSRPAPVADEPSPASAPASAPAPAPAPVGPDEPSPASVGPAGFFPSKSMPSEQAKPPQDPSGRPQSTSGFASFKQPSASTRPVVNDVPPPASSSGVQMQISRPRRETQVVRDAVGLPQLKDMIPPERLRVEGKDATQLREDILFFYRTFPNQLKTVKFDRKNVNREYLERIHKRITAKLIGSGMPSSKAQVGVVISGAEYIKDKLREIIMENSINGLSAQDLIVNIEGSTPDDGISDIGAYEIKTAQDGKLSAQREPVYRFIPETQPKLPPKGGKSQTYKQNIEVRYKQLKENLKTIHLLRNKMQLN